MFLKLCRKTKYDFWREEEHREGFLLPWLATMPTAYKIKDTVPKRLYVHKDSLNNLNSYFKYKVDLKYTVETEENFNYVTVRGIRLVRGLAFKIMYIRSDLVMHLENTTHLIWNILSENDKIEIARDLVLFSLSSIYKPKAIHVDTVYIENETKDPKLPNFFFYSLVIFTIEKMKKLFTIYYEITFEEGGGENEGDHLFIFSFKAT